MYFLDTATMDELGRILLPAPLREKLELKEGNLFDFRVSAGGEVIEILKVAESKEELDNGNLNRYFLD